MKLKNLKVRTMLFVLLTGLPFQMCTVVDDDFGCGCGSGPSADYFDINGFEMLHAKKAKIGASSIKENEVINYFNYYGLVVNYTVDYISYNTPPQKPRFSLTPELYACSCKQPGDSGSKNEKLKNITVITVNDFDDNHKANDTITDITRIRQDRIRDYLKIDDYLKTDSTLIRTQNFELKIDKAPTINKTFQAKVIIELSTGEIYDETSKPVIFE